MKKFILLSIVTLSIIGSTSTALAANNVARMAVTKGGQHIAYCAQMMDYGISSCVNLTSCHLN